MIRPSEAQLIASLDPALQPYVAELLRVMRQVGWKPRITSARRSQRAQEELIRAGKTTATRSYHLSGLAIDLAGLSAAQLREAGELWEYWGGRWGGNFRKPDPIHFDAG